MYYRIKILLAILCSALVFTVTYMIWSTADNSAGFQYQFYTIHVSSLSEASTFANATTPTTGNMTNSSTNLTVAATAATKMTTATQMLKTVTKNHVPLQKELTHLFGVSFRDCPSSTVSKRSCRQYNKMRFLTEADETYKRNVALSSYPGSGNTWLRLILEEATGVFTGAVYNDRTLRCDGFLGEGLNDKKVLAVKTHEAGGYFDAVIFLVRNPYRAMMSYQAFTLTGGHKKSANFPKVFPERSFSNYLAAWDNLWNARVWNAKVPYYIVEYEKLKTNLEDALIGVLDFLQFPIDEERMKCVVQNNHVQYHRPIVNMTNPYTEEQQRKIEGWISKHKEGLAKLNISYTEWSW